MKFAAYVHPSGVHQGSAASILKAGLARHGHSMDIRTYGQPIEGDILVTWGWRLGKLLSSHGRPVLVMEQAYVGDRFEWTSYGWNGLNGNARFHIEDDGGDRWRKHFPDMLRPQKQDGDYVLIMGQVQNDASLFGSPDMDGWYRSVHRKAGNRLGLPVLFRDHPRARGQWAPDLPRLSGSLEDALDRAACVIAYNSNSLVDARLAGIPIIAGNRGTMAWPVSDTLANIGRSHDLEIWCHRLAWTQWTSPEIESGTAIPFILKGMDAPVFSERELV